MRDPLVSDSSEVDDTSNHIGARPRRDRQLDVTNIVESVLVESALIENDVWRMRFMRQYPLSWPYRVWVEPTETFVKIGGRRILPYLRFQRLLIGLYATLCALGTPLLLVNAWGDCCESLKCFSGVSNIVPPACRPTAAL